MLSAMKFLGVGMAGRWLATLLCLGLLWTPGKARAEPKDLTDLSLEELMQIEVTTVSKKGQKLSDAAAAIFVITNEDIRRSGVTSIPEALRLAPGLNVAHIGSNSWAISSRGFNGRFANKLQVLVDGRSVYTPTFSGVYWEAQDTRLEDVERIEVIRSPGATLWGSNAVNGIVNIITKSAKQTQGGDFSFGTGTYEKRFGSLRYGAQLGEDTYGRAYMKGFARGQFHTPSGPGVHDDWESYRGGFRVDHNGAEGSDWTVQGDMYRGDLGETLRLPSLAAPYMNNTVGRAPISGFNLLGRWKQALSVNSEFTFQSYYDHTYRKDLYFTEQRDTLDFDFQHRFAWLDDHDIVWGLYYRWTRPEYSESFPFVIEPNRQAFNLYSAFLQDDFTLLPGTLKLTVGAKIEHNGYTGMEGQPNVRLLWTPAREHSLWGAISRAVRIPSVVENSGLLTTVVFAPSTGLNTSPLPGAVTFQGNGQYRAEVLWSYELGYRFMPRQDFSADIALFYNVYDSLRAYRSLSPTLVDGTYAQALVPFTNNASGDTYGAEIALDWRPMDRWQLQLNYTYLNMNLREKPVAGVVPSVVAATGASPLQQVSLRSGYNPVPDVDLDLWLRYVDRLPTSGPSLVGFTTYIPAYVTLDTRLAWRPMGNLELSVTGQNLLASRHTEFDQETYAPPLAGVPRSVYAKIDWKF